MKDGQSYTILVNKVSTTQIGSYTARKWFETLPVIGVGKVSQQQTCRYMSSVEVEELCRH